jgi:uncharacterized protein YprB with RNaseH-like and TPR domain
MAKSSKSHGPRVLFLDIETAPILGYVWSLWQQDVGLNQIKQDWFILSWAAKWQGDDHVMYADQRKSRDIENDKALMLKLWKLLDQTDILVTQNGKAFDEKKINARFVLHGIKPPRGYKHRDTKQIAKSNFAFTSNRLEYMADKLCGETKSKHQEFPGFELWRECLKGNPKAWREMEKYNKRDVVILEKVYDVIAPWDTKVNYNVYHDREDFVCQCGHPAFKREGYHYSPSGKFQRYRCKRCGALYRSRENLFSAEKRKSLMSGAR